MKEPKKMEAMKILKDLKENSIIINNRNPNDNDQVQINGLFKKKVGIVSKAPKWFQSFETKDQLWKVRIEKRLDVIEEDIKVLKEDIKVLKEDIKVLKEDVKVLKEDVKVLKEDMIEVKKDIVELKKDVAAIKNCPTIKRELTLNINQIQ